MRRLEIKILGNKHVANQLDKHLRSEISKTIGPGLPAIKKILKTLKFDHEKLKDTDLNTVIKEKLLAKAGTSPSIKKEIKNAMKILAAAPRSAVVKDILRLDTPLNEHPLLAEDFRKAKALEFVKIIKLNNKKKANDLAKKLEKHKLDIDKANSATLNEFVKDGIITDKQKKELLITIDLSRLSGGNIELIEAVKNDKLKSLEDFVTWDRSDWAELITDNKIPVPEGEEGAESYAENIRKNIEKTFPTPYFLKRVIKKKNSYNPEINLLDSINALYKRNDTIIEGTSINIDKFNWTGISNVNKKKIEKDLDKFLSFANTYRELGVAEIVNDKTLNTNKKRKDAITDRLANLESFYKNNSNLDLAMTDFAGNRARFNWDEIPEGERPRVRKQLMVYQRLFNLTEDSDTARKMLDKGYSSGFDIIDTAEGDFIKTSGLDKEKGREVYSNAMKTTTAASHLFEVVRDIHSGLFQEFAVSNQASILSVFRDYDGYEELFGSQNFCDCAHCKSILGPSAYFTDLMYFVQKNVSNNVFGPNPLEHDLYLGSRRPDLWKLELTCQNTSTEIPYLEVVNDVLEQYLAGEVSMSMWTDLYDWLREFDLSMNLPFNLPLEELRLYLSHYELDLYDVYRLLEEPLTRQYSERLKISEKELEIITNTNPADALAVFGNIALPDFDVQDFIRAAGISRRELDDLLKIEFLPEIAEVKVKVKKKFDDIQQYEEVLLNLTDTRLDLIHRFVRFWKKTSWTIREFDLVLNFLKSADLLENLEENDVDGNPKIVQVSELSIIQEALGLSVEEVCAMVGDIPQIPIEENQKGMYERLFDLEKILALDTTKEEIPPLLMVGLGISGSEYDALFKLVDPDNNLPIDITLISNLFRHARIARGLSLSIEDFINAIKLTINGLPVSELDHIHDLIEFTSWLKSLPFTVSELKMILLEEESSSLKYRNDVNTVTAAVLDIQVTIEDRQAELNDLLQQSYKLTNSQMDDLKSSTYTTNEVEAIILTVGSESKTIHENDSSLLQTILGKNNLLIEYLQRAFNLTGKQLKNEFLAELVSIDITDIDITNALDAVFNNGVPDDITVFDKLVTLIRELERADMLLRNLEFEAETITFLIRNKEVFGITDLKGLTLDNVKNLVYYKSLLEINKEMEGEIGDVLKSYQSNKSFSTEDIKTLSDLWQQSEEQIQALVNSLLSTFDPNAPALQTVTFLWEAQGVCQKLGIRGDFLVKLTATDSEGLRAAVEIAIGAFASRYAEEDIRNEKLEPYVDKINTLKRDALCDFIMTRREQF